jgi:hypothetical protein
MGIENLQSAHQQEGQAAGVDPMTDANECGVSMEEDVRTRGDKAQGPSQGLCWLDSHTPGSAIIRRVR